MRTSMKPDTNNYVDIPFKMHPRIFSALGADLVTNDIVAIIELVKNAYDASASHVSIKFGSHPKLGPYIEILDDGTGMTKKIIEDVWCTVATPYRLKNSIAEGSGRRVSGEKGLGRLSVARLGEELSIVTKAKNELCWNILVNWGLIAKSSEIKECHARLQEYTDDLPFEKTGTQLRIYNLKNIWDEKMMPDLQDNLARLISPFSGIGDFKILLSPPGTSDSEMISIESPDFLSEPKYVISGKVDKKGSINCNYKFSPIKEGKNRSQEISLSWQQVYDSIQDKNRLHFSPDKYNAGEFSFEIRAWDIGVDDTQEIADHFKYQKGMIRKSIKAHKGISVYRDNLLALPKSDDARDWLGLDLRRISKVGTRLSTSQIVGYVSISADNNPFLIDTSNREGLTYNLEVAEFQEMLKAIIYMMENERDIDRSKIEREKPFEDLFAELDASKLVDQTSEMVVDGSEASEFIPIIKNYSSKFEIAKKTIQERLAYYSRLATVGTITQMIVHEIRNKTTTFGAFLDIVVSRFGPFKENDLRTAYTRARDSIDSLERLSDTFAPLASRSFRRRRKEAILEERVKGCLSLQQGDIDRKNIKCIVPDSSTSVAVDPGELDAIIINLTSNALYWLGQVEYQRELSFNFKKIQNDSRIKVQVMDNGPGIDDDLLEKIFWPGVTRKPGGIGMGLTVASELVSEYGGKMGVQVNDKGKGANFFFDIPVKL